MQLNGQVLTITELPSRFLEYDVDFISVRALTFEEIKILSSRNLPANIVASVFNGAILNFEVGDLSYMDYEFIMIAISLFTDPNQKWEWETECKHCGKRFRTVLDGKMISNFDDIKTPQLPIVIDIKDKNGVSQELEFGLYTVSQHLKLASSKYDTYNEGVLQFAACVKNKSIEESYEIIKNVNDATDLAVLRQVDMMLEHKMKPAKLTHKDIQKVEGVDKDICGKGESYELEFKPQDLYPFLPDQGSITSRIKFKSKVSVPSR